MEPRAAALVGASFDVLSVCVCSFNLTNVNYVLYPISRLQQPITHMHLLLVLVLLL